MKKYSKMYLPCHLILIVLFIFVVISPNLLHGNLGDEFATADLEEPLEAIKSKNWQKAIDLLLKIIKEYPEDPDAHNFLGYSLRNINKLQDALTYYKLALDLDPDHINAHEYIGHTYLLLGNLNMASYHLSRINELCSDPCKEQTQLVKGIEKFKINGSIESEYTNIR